MKRIFLILLFYTVLVDAQSFSLGFDIDASQVRINYKNQTHTLDVSNPPISLHLDFSFNQNEKLSWRAILGGTIFTEFTGFELGINGRYKFYKSLYFTAGLQLHSNSGGGVSNSYSVSYASILMVHAGIGLDISRIFAIELDYYKPTSEKEIQKVLLYNKKTSSYYWESKTFFDMLRINFIFAWEL